MSLLGVLIAYACCWWLVLFMVLPWKVRLPDNPGAGHAPSAPMNPMLKRKVFITTLLAILPTVAIYVLVSDARAHEVYHAGTGCPPMAGHRPDPGIHTDGGDATMQDGGNIMGALGDVYVGLDVPAKDYLPGDNPDLRYSELYLGAVKVKRDGGLEYNGQPVSPPPVYGKDCK